jgi:hypothetical protein
MTVKDRHQALLSIGAVVDRLRAWRDNAALVLKHCDTSDKERWQNEKDNYQYLITCLSVVETIILQEC